MLHGFEGIGTFAHGVHPPERKNFSADAAIEVVPPPENVLIPLLQNIGAPCEPIVKPKQRVALGEMIGKGKGFVAAALFSPIAGKVQKPATATLPNGRHVPAISIKAEGEQLAGDALQDEILGGEQPDNIEKYDPKDIFGAIQDAGLVGLGGATFPTHVKFARNDKKPVDTVLINGCECEPYLTADYRVMVEAADVVVTGALLARRAAGAEDVIICIEDNKPLAVEAVKKAAQGTRIQIAVVRTKYPQGSEKQLIMAVLNREVPFPPGLPLDVGVVVSNVGTAASITRAVLKGRPLTHRVMTVTGAGIANPKNLLVPIGISFKELVEYCGGLTQDAARMIAGGPMMGFAFGDLNTPVTKGTSGLTILTHEDVRKAEETACVRCGRCVDACPMNLVPTKIALASRYKDPDLAQKYNIMGCFECGSCAYTCPASIPLVQLVRTGKAMVMAATKK